MKVSIVIPTLNRPQELVRLLESIVIQTILPVEIIIVDQGEGVGQEVEQFSQLPIRLFKVHFQSLTKARNYGVQKSKGDVIGFLDDDVILERNYVEHALQFFDAYPHALGVQGVISDFEEGHAKKVGGKQWIYFLYNNIAKLFLLNSSVKERNRLLWSGRNQYASRVSKIVPCEWLSGIGIYRREVFRNFSFDERLEGYALGEDKLFSYQIFQTQCNSLFIDPSIKCLHKHALSGRPYGEEWVSMKIRYTYYLWEKLFKPYGLFAYLAYWWANIGDLIVVFLSVLSYQHPPNFLWWHIREYIYIIWKKERLV